MADVRKHDDEPHEVQDEHEDEHEDEHDHRLKGDQTRFVEYSFGNLQTQNMVITGELVMSGIAMGSPVDGGTIKIPPKISSVILQNIYPYTQLDIAMPLLPEYGKILSIVSTVDVTNLNLTNGLFGTEKPTSMTANVPLRFIFAGMWFNT